MICEDCRRLVSIEIDGGLGDEDRARVSGHVLACRECSRHREEVRGAAVLLDGVCLPLREEADEIVASLPGDRPGTEVVPVQPSWRLLWGLVMAVVFLIIVFLISRGAR